MTGHGEGIAENERISVRCEVRTVNHRFLKVSVRTNESNHGLDSRVEEIARERLQRGAVHLDVRIDRKSGHGAYSLDLETLRRYREQLEKFCDKIHLTTSVGIEALLQLPGVAAENVAEKFDIDRDWAPVEKATREALDRLQAMREREGAAMAADLLANAAVIRRESQGVKELAPRVAEKYRDRLLERVRQFLSGEGVEIEPAHIVRETALFAERADVSEELVRLDSHLDQFAEVVGESAAGRKLDFVIQEMFRETNTIGSKANDSDIARHVIEMKTAIERMREMIQNVE